MNDEVLITDVMEVAIRLERQSLNFYNKLSEKHADKDVQEIFSLLASEEEKHVGTYVKLLDKNADYHPQFKYGGTYGKYLDNYSKMVFSKLISENRFYSEFNSLLDKVEHRSNELLSHVVDLFKVNDIYEAFTIAREMELSVIMFYTEMVPLFDGAGKEIIHQILLEEKDHIKKINAILKSIKLKKENDKTDK